MLNRNWINRGLCVATGLFLGSAVILPAFTDRTFGSGLRRGLASAVLTLILFAIIGAFRREPDSADAGSGDDAS